MILALAMCVSLIGSAAALDLTTTPGSIVYTFAKNKMAELNGSAVPSTNAIGDWWNPAKNIEDSAGNVYLGNRFVPWSVVDFENHGWKYFDVSENTFVAGENIFRLMNLGGDYLAVLNSYANQAKTYIENGTQKLALELEKPNNAG